MSHKFVNDAREVVKTGDIVKVKVLEVDIGAQAHLADPAPGRRRWPPVRPIIPNGPCCPPGSGPGGPGRTKTADPKPADGALADALRRAGLVAEATEGP